MKSVYQKKTNLSNDLYIFYFIMYANMRVSIRIASPENTLIFCSIVNKLQFFKVAGLSMIQSIIDMLE